MVITANGMQLVDTEGQAVHSKWKLPDRMNERINGDETAHPMWMDVPIRKRGDGEEN